MEKSQIKPNELWDRAAESYARLNESYYPAKLEMDLLIKHASSASCCLDIGIANGIYSLPLSGYVKSIDGIDISQKMLDYCRSSLDELEIKNVCLHRASAEDLPFEEQQFDLIFSYATLVLVPNMMRAIAEIYRTLKTGGVAILDITGKNNLSWRYWQKNFYSTGEFGLSTLSLHEIKQAFPAIGFRIIEIHPVGVLDQWKFVRGLGKLNFLSRITHAANAAPDLDYRVSNLIPKFANHYFLVMEKISN